MRELFQVVFGTPMSDALWHWKYANGRGVAMGVWNVQDELVAHYAGFPRQVLMFGKPVTAMQMGDVMVRPNERGTLSRKGPFFLATSAFLTRYVGYDQAALLGYGFSNDRHMQLGAGRGLYERNGKVVNLRCSAQRSAVPWWRATRPFLPSETGWQRKVDQLWAKMAQATADAVVPLRNSDWVQQRFLEHPTLRYELTWLYHRVSRKPLALLVYRRKAGDIEWIDLIAAPVNWPNCARAMQGIAAALGRRVSTCGSARPMQIGLAAIRPPPTWASRFPATPGHPDRPRDHTRPVAANWRGYRLPVAARRWTRSASDRNPQREVVYWLNAAP
ncbi:MAG: GNAT family N-acetyltransferase [Rhodoferax sp.]|nr:GNAT family N-acetyltransferase [Rhodoferax sp.]